MTDTGIVHNTKPRKLILYLHRKRKDRAIASEIATEIKTTPSHVHTLLNDLEALDIVDRATIKGRSKPVVLTTKGKKIAKGLDDVERARKA